jgi:hypothetical protein
MSRDIIQTDKNRKVANERSELYTNLCAAAFNLTKKKVYALMEAAKKLGR